MLDTARSEGVTLGAEHIGESDALWDFCRNGRTFSREPEKEINVNCPAAEPLAFAGLAGRIAALCEGLPCCAAAGSIPDSDHLSRLGGGYIW